MATSKDILEKLTPAQRELFMLRMSKASKEKIQKNKIQKKSEEGVPFPLSFAQIRLWFLDQLEPGNPVYNMPAAVDISGNFDVEILEKAINEIIRRHHSLRTSFAPVDDSPMQTINPLIPIKIPVVEINGLKGEEQNRKISELIREEAKIPFDLKKAPLIRAKVFKLAEDNHIITLNVHHIVSDGLSMVILVRELTTLYTVFSEIQSSPLPEISIQYADFAIWQREKLEGENLAKELEYWEEVLKDSPAFLNLPTDYKRPPVQTFNGSNVSIAFEKEFTKDVKAFAHKSNLTTFMVLVTALNILLYKYSGQTDIVIGTPIAGRNIEETENLIGLFLNNLIIRTQVDENQTFNELLQKVKEICLGAYSHQDMPFEKLVEELSPERNMSHSPLFQVMFVLQGETGNSRAKRSDGDLAVKGIATENGTAKFDLTFQLLETAEFIGGIIEYRTDLFHSSSINRLIEHFKNLVRSAIENPEQKVWELEMMSEQEKQEILVVQNQTETEFDRTMTIDELISEQAKKIPQKTALICGNHEISYAELEKRSNQLARYLRSKGVGQETLVGVNVERSIEMVISLLGVLKAGGGYVPLDPLYPEERLKYMIADAGLEIVISGKQSNGLGNERVEEINIFDDWDKKIGKEKDEKPGTQNRTGEDTAYVIYTSGSTGKPKGVILQHCNVINFFEGMNSKLGNENPGTWLAVTSISFDISVLEIFWTLTNGAKVVIRQNQFGTAPASTNRKKFNNKKVDFGLFYFANNEITNNRDSYKILLEGAKYADQNGFTAVWTPERHFHSFGGLYPNPAITNAALATITENISLRAGSVVLPLHDVVRVAEEWAVVDLISNGRTGISFASGWHADDFVLMPDNYDQRSEVMYQKIEKFKSLWKGEKTKLTNGLGKEIEIQTLPRPLQEDLPIWITTGGNPETFRQAGERGAYLLTHFLVQNIGELEEKIKIYREAWRKHSGKPGDGYVSLMIHTFVSDNIEYVEEVVKKPFRDYLRGSLGLVKNLYRGVEEIGIKTEFSDEDIDVMLDYSFNRYFRTASLMGTPEDCLKVVDDLKKIGVDELACLIDFGIESNVVLDNLKYLKQVMETSNQVTENEIEADVKPPEIEVENLSIIEQIKKYQVNHLQCTPSLIQMIGIEQESTRELGSLEQLLLGGEAIPQNLAVELKHKMSGELHNMYGPTETTIWSSTTNIENPEKGVTIGKPIANTQIYILDNHLQAVPFGITGEIYIGGEGIARGYKNKPDLTAEKFIPNPFTLDQNGRTVGTRLYRTGDQGYLRPDGMIEFVGRADNQVKIRGFRIELGEIETVLESFPQITRAVVTATGAGTNEARLIGYVTGDGDEKPEVSRIRKHLQSKLPEYMIPSLFIVLDEMPLTPNGKIDRRSLPEPDGEQVRGENEYVEPRTPTEETVVEIWKEVLRAEKIGVHDNFFELGGHSLLATLLLSRIQKMFSVELPLRVVFESPTVAEQAEAIIQIQVETIGDDSLAKLSDEISQLSEEELQTLLNEEKSAVASRETK